MKRCFCCLMAAAFIFLTASCGKSEPPDETGKKETTTQQPTFTAYPSSLQKQEAVFVSLSPDGSVQSVSVTDRLLTDAPQVQVRDVSILRDIENLKGEEVPERDGAALTWHMQSTQLYYGGKTDKALPVSLSIRYYWNGQPIGFSDLQGKKGDVRIEAYAVNHTAAESFVPFLLAGGTILGDDASQIAVENGGSLGDGNRDVVFGVLLPGLNAALGQTGDTALLPERFSVSFRTDNCKLDNLYFAMVPLSTAKLSEAVELLFGAQDMPQLDFSPVLTQLRQFNAKDSLSDFLRQAADSAALFRAAQQAMQGYGRTQPLLDVLQRYLTAENAALLQETIDSLSGASLREYAALLQEPAFISLMADMSTVSAAFTKLIPTLTAMISDLQSDEVRAAIAALPDTMEKLQTLSAALQENGQFLDTLTDFTQNGGLSQLGSLLQSVQSMLDSGALETLQSLSGRAGELEEKLSAVLQAGKEYGIFTSAPQDAVTSVYFIFKTQ